MDRGLPPRELTFRGALPVRGGAVSRIEGDKNALPEGRATQNREDWVVPGRTDYGVRPVKPTSAGSHSGKV
jgi:hypothetical protein